MLKCATQSQQSVSRLELPALYYISSPGMMQMLYRRPHFMGDNRVSGGTLLPDDYIEQVIYYFEANQTLCTSIYGERVSAVYGLDILFRYL